ncbi:esterase-like activity of phytase family protein [Qipengyuania marisflavi]|uniref:Esterase-like activity of phytase family protein n=1 Tax=Qipengyuania marisflavi TaxID=2486356 RepID=A0A5S3P5Q0_9SPHN|nr:esterase-like activity of phytase family protein [Qipengyuania marisflavi]TMM48256.1 esterase-like activity of phytase family protein [Qipengyuania marisflavi]
MRKFRLTLALLIAAGLSPGILWRSEPQPLDRQAPVDIVRLDIPHAKIGPFRLNAAWQLSSDSPMFGGYSALALRPGRTLVAASDGGRLLFLRREGGALADAYLDRFKRVRDADKSNFDIEAMTLDDVSGRMWMAYEGSNTIERFAPDFEAEARARPPAMRNWSGNTGPEAMVRLSDGRFIVLSEGTGGLFRSAYRGLLFAGDPTDRATPAPVRFGLEGTDGYAPVDMAALPDGRVLILLRKLRWPFPPRFGSAIAIADPARIAAGKPWQARVIARLDAPVPSDNYEGIAVEIGRQGERFVWLISDDNDMQHFQRTLLLRLRWAD